MTLSDDRLRKRLRHPFKYFNSVDSSNDIAKAWLLDGAPEMAAVIADEQVRGRGRRGRIWHTPANQALALSVILRPQPNALAGVTMLGALSVYDLASATGCECVGIKWPNDVQVDGKKVSGILPEAVWRGKRLQGVVLGIGVNVRNDFTGTELEGTAISLEAASGRCLDRADLAGALLDRLEYWYRQVDADELLTQWRTRLNMLNQYVSAEGLQGLAMDVTAEGELLLRTDDGQIHVVSAGDIAVGERPGQGQ